MNDNKKIAANTIILTIKLIISIVVSFVVSRLLLEALGVDDYGLYNVIGGIVAMLNLVGTSMVATSYRYLAIEIGRGDQGNPQKVYSTLSIIHISLAILLLIFGELIGYYYVDNYLNVTNASIDDAQFLLVFSLIGAAASVVAVPSNGLLIAKENFITISLVEIGKTLFNLTIAIVLLKYGGNRLRLYAVLMSVCSFILPLSYYLYCRRHYAQIMKFKFNKVVQDYKEIAGFAVWTLLGASALVGKLQGAAMIINLFFSNAFNAAYGVAGQVSHAASLFTSTIRQSAVPQIMKNQESNEERSLSLVYAISRYTFLIMLVVSVPLLFSIDMLLHLWLGDVIPPFTRHFIIFFLISGMISNLSSGFDASIQATGKIKIYHIGYTFIYLSLLPIIYVAYKLGAPVYANVIVNVFLTLVLLVFQIYMMTKLTKFSLKEYWKATLWPSLLTTFVVILPLLVVRLFRSKGSLSFEVIFFALSLGWGALCTFMLGLSRRERGLMIDFAVSKLKKKSRSE